VNSLTVNQKAAGSSSAASTTFRISQIGASSRSAGFHLTEPLSFIFSELRDGISK
jgi:hypothetical protein